jgi:hypothetical protein
MRATCHGSHRWEKENEVRGRTPHRGQWRLGDGDLNPSPGMVLLGPNLDTWQRDVREERQHIESQSGMALIIVSGFG